MVTLVGISLASTMAAVLLGMPAQTVYSYVALLMVTYFCYKIMNHDAQLMMRFTKKIKPSSPRRSMMAV
jgi:hypothetical protein